MFIDNKPLVDQISLEAYCELYSDKKSYLNLAYGNPLMDFVPTLSDLKEVLRDSKVQHIPIKRKRN